jgi:thymidine phosphorylase
MEWFAAQGGGRDVFEVPDALPFAPVLRTMNYSGRSGFVHEIHAGTVGLTVIDLGGGRHKKEDKIDPSVGIVFHVEVGSRVNAGQPLCTIHAATDEAAAHAEERVAGAIRIGSEAIEAPKLVIETL